MLQYQYPMGERAMLALAAKPLLPGFKVGALLDGWQLAFRGPNPLRDPAQPEVTVFKFDRPMMGRRAVTMVPIVNEWDDGDAWETLRVSLKLAEIELCALAPTVGHA